MAPSATAVDVQAPTTIVAKSPVIPTSKDHVSGLTKSASYPTPLTYSGTLDSYQSFDVTSVIGREFPNLQLTEILNDDAKIRDLAILVSQRGVVFFRNQDIAIEDQKILGQKLGELTGKPASSKVCLD
jgi:Taurine catabolism dioxygenase TauD, TfdA family